MITTKNADYILAQSRLAKLRSLRDRTRGDVLLQSVTHLRTVELLEECRTLRKHSADARRFAGTKPIGITSVEINGKSYGVIGADYSIRASDKDPGIYAAQMQLGALRRLGRFRANYRTIRMYLLLTLREYRRRFEAAQ